MSAIDALYIYTYSSAPASPPPALLFQHEWRSRPPCPPSTLLSHYTSAPSPPPPVLYIPSTTPPILLFNLTYSNLIILSPITTEIEPLLVFEFLRRVVDVLEDYLGAPLTSQRIESSYDVVAQVLNEMADDGLPFTTEPNALKDVVIPQSLIGKIFGSVTGLPSTSLSLGSQQPTALSQIPWRRSNVKHTANELYVDLIETLTIILAPSGRPIAARADGTIAFTSKLSGVPDILLTLSPPSAHKHRLTSAPTSFLSSPVFHPCVRLSRWRDRPGELSFIPPDGKFILASYEVDLLPATISSKSASPLQLPVNVEISTGIGPDRNEFEVRVFISTSSLAPTTSTHGARSPSGFSGSSAQPAVEELTIRIPLSPTIKSLLATRASKGEFHHEGPDIIWQIHPPTNGGTATFKTGIQIREEEEEEEEGDEAGEGDSKGEERERERLRRIMKAMPRACLLGFRVKGWLASGVKVEGVRIVGGRGMGEGVKPYKGVKYVTRAGAVEVRC